MLMKSMEELVEKFKDSHQIKAGEVLFPPATAKAVIEDLLDKEVKLLGVDLWYEHEKEGGICEDPGGLDLQGLTPDTPEASRKIAKAFIDECFAKPQIKFFSLVF